MTTERPAGVAYVALGSNLGDREGTLSAALRELRSAALPATELLRCSPVFETRPIGPSTAPFLNAVAELRTRLSPLDLLTGLLALEDRHGRTRQVRWGARTLDLDLLVYLVDGRSQREDSPRLTLPHRELARRDFVLAPLAALAPDLRPWGEATVAELLAALAPEDRTILAPPRPLSC
ncbi:MAG TPA: 2-amino-4-hydroxy-6-hydroxymethyldihydropteridine diphosphokinase [Nannocystis sp.]